VNASALNLSPVHLLAIAGLLCAVRLRCLELFRKEIKKGLRVMARDDVIRSILVYIASRRNSYHRQIAENALQLSNGLFKRRVVKLSMDYGHINLRESTQKLCASIFGIRSDYIVACGLQD
jgi:hypothetical protein